MNTQNESEYRDEMLKQKKINNKLLVIIGKILLESQSHQISDNNWHKWDDQIKELKKEI